MENFGAFLEAAGWVLGGILGLSIVMWAIIIDGFSRLHDCAQWMNSYAARQRWRAACRARSSPYARHREPYFWGERVRHSVAPHVRMSRVLVTILPLLGLLGTVIGMIQSFRVLAQAAQEGSLTTGIRRALLTTLAGLVTALSGVYTVYRLERKAERLAQEITTQVALIARSCVRKCEGKRKKDATS